MKKILLLVVLAIIGCCLGEDEFASRQNLVVDYMCEALTYLNKILVMNVGFVGENLSHAYVQAKLDEFKQDISPAKLRMLEDAMKKPIPVMFVHLLQNSTSKSAGSNSENNYGHLIIVFGSILSFLLFLILFIMFCNALKDRFSVRLRRK